MLDSDAVTIISADKEAQRAPWLRNLFVTSFPWTERPPFFFMRLRAKQNVDWWIIKVNNEHAGFFYVLKFDDHVFIFFFAIVAHLRKQGIGTHALIKLLPMYADKTVFLAIEELDPKAANYAERVKRKQFYLRCGLHELHQRLQEGCVYYELLGTNGAVDPQKYRQMMQRWLIWPITVLLTYRILP